jgi:hypothetical protein
MSRTRFGMNGNEPSNSLPPSPIPDLVSIPLREEAVESNRSLLLLGPKEMDKLLLRSLSFELDPPIKLITLGLLVSSDEGDKLKAGVEGEERGVMESGGAVADEMDSIVDSIEGSSGGVALELERRRTLRRLRRRGLVGRGMSCGVASTGGGKVKAEGDFRICC